MSLRLITDQEYKLRHKNTSTVLSQSVRSSVERGVTCHKPRNLFVGMDCEMPPISKPFLMRSIIPFMITQIINLFKISSGIFAKGTALSQRDLFLCGLKIQNIEFQRKIWHSSCHHHLSGIQSHCGTTTLCFVRLLAGWPVRYQQKKQLCLCSANATNKVCYSAVFPPPAQSWRTV